MKNWYQEWLERNKPSAKNLSKQTYYDACKEFLFKENFFLAYPDATVSQAAEYCLDEVMTVEKLTKTEKAEVAARAANRVSLQTTSEG